MNALALLLAGSPYVQVLFEVVAGGELVGVVATKAAYGSRLLLVDDVAGRRIDEILPPETAASLRAGLRDSIRVSEPFSYEEFARLGDREVWGMTTLTPLIDDRGVPAHVLMSFLELDFVERTEAALAHSEASLRQLVDASSDAIVITFGDRIVHANAAAAERFAIVAGQPLEALLPGFAAPLDATTRSLATIAGASVEIVAIALSDREPSFLLVMKPKDE